MTLSILFHHGVFLIHFRFRSLDILEGEIFLQNLPSIIVAHALGKLY